MRWRTVLLAWVVALLAVVAWAALEVVVSSGTVPVAPLVWQPPAADSVDRIEINRGRGEPLVFERTGPAWRQTKPIAVQVEPMAIRQLIDAALGLQSEGGVDFTGSDEARALGLAEGAPEVLFRAGSKEFRFALGHRISAGRAWVRMNGEPGAHRTMAALHELALSADERQWRRRALFERADVDADRVSVEALDARSDKRIALEVVRDGSVWRMERPVRTRADQEGVLRLLEALGGAAVTGFVVDNPESVAAFGLDNPVAAIEVESTQRTVNNGVVSSQKRIEGVLLGTQLLTGSPDRFAMIRGLNSVLELDGPTIASLLPDLSQLIDARASGVAVADVTGMQVVMANGKEIKLGRKGESWLLESSWVPMPQPRELPSDIPNRLLEKLCTAKASGFELGSAPEKLLMATVTLLGLDSKPAATLRISHEEIPGGKWAIDAGDGLLRVFDPQWGESLERLLAH